MRAGELCVRDVVTADETESVTEAARRMAELHVGDLVVVAEQPGGLPRPIGIVTDRDLVVQVLARPERSPAHTTIAEVMRREPVTATEDEDVEHVVAKMRAHAIRRIPIVDRLGGLQGMLSVDDVLVWTRDQLQLVTKLVEQQGRGPQLVQRPR
jgi:CBS domain-containing protein